MGTTRTVYPLPSSISVTHCRTLPHTTRLRASQPEPRYFAQKAAFLETSSVSGTPDLIPETRSWDEGVTAEGGDCAGDNPAEEASAAGAA